MPIPSREGCLLNGLLLLLDCAELIQFCVTGERSIAEISWSNCKWTLVPLLYTRGKKINFRDVHVAQSMQVYRTEDVARSSCCIGDFLKTDWQKGRADYITCCVYACTVTSECHLSSNIWLVQAKCWFSFVPRVSPWPDKEGRAWEQG